LTASMVHPRSLASRWYGGTESTPVQRLFGTLDLVTTDELSVR